MSDWIFIIGLIFVSCILGFFVYSMVTFPSESFCQKFSAHKIDDKCYRVEQYDGEESSRVCYYKPFSNPPRLGVLYFD